MSKIRLFGVVLSMFAFTVVKAGSSDVGLKHEGGVFFSIFSGDDFVTGDYGITYTPRLNYPISNATSVSADLPLAFGLNFAVNSQSGGDGMFSFQIPLKGSFNYGLGANDDDSFGVFAGAGLGMGYFSFADTWSVGSGFGTGLYVDTGLRLDMEDRGKWSIAANALLTTDMSIFGLRASLMF